MQTYENAQFNEDHSFTPHPLLPKLSTAQLINQRRSIISKNAQLTDKSFLTFQFPTVQVGSSLGLRLKKNTQDI